MGNEILLGERNRANLSPVVFASRHMVWLPRFVTAGVCPDCLESDDALRTQVGENQMFPSCLNLDLAGPTYEEGLRNLTPKLHCLAWPTNDRHHDVV